MREQVKALAERQEERLARFRQDRRFSGVRRLGTITALDLKVADPGYLANVALQLSRFFQDRGLLLRPLGNTIYVLPPYCVTAAELDLVYDAILDAAGKFA